MKLLHRLSRILLPPTLLVLALLVYRVAMTSVEGPAVKPGDLATARDLPWKIAPRYNEPRVVTDEQLAAVLDRVKPPASPVLTNNFVHALRLWGAEADFGDPTIPTGAELRNYFLDDRVFQKFAGADAPPLFYRDGDGVEARSFDDQTAFRETSSYHLDDLLATLGETGTPRSTPLRLREGTATVNDLITASMRRYNLERLEFEWTAIVYARYLFPLPEWRNKFGDKIDASRLIAECINLPLADGQCNGLHRLEALAVLQRADEQAHALTPRNRRDILVHMRRVSNLLTESQTVEGYWNRHWPAGRAALADKTATIHDKILVTGHQLEWLALAPPEVQPPPETIVRAAQWLTRALLELDDQQLIKAYGPYTHGARALCLWRSAEPIVAWRKGQSPAVTETSGVVGR
jgi:hypothetical protein